MKKLITLFAAVLMAVVANAQNEEPIFYSGGVADWCQMTVDVNTSAENFHIDFRGKWSTYKIIGENNSISTSDYKGIKVEYKIASGATIGINVNPHGKQYAPLALDKEETTVLFNEETMKLGTISDLTLQQADAGKVSIDVKDLYLIKTDGTEEKMKSVDGQTNTVFSSGVLYCDRQWANSRLVGDDGNDLTMAIDDNKTHRYTVEFDEAPTVAVRLNALYDTGKKNEWNDAIMADLKGYPIEAGKTKVDIDIKASDLVLEGTPTPMSRLQLQTTEEKFSGKVGLKIKSIKRTIIDPTGVEKVEVLNASNAEFVNAAGQKVGKNYKGLVINKATGKKYINK